MNALRSRRAKRSTSLLKVVAGCLLASNVHGQWGNTFYFTSGPIPQCDTSIFTANVTGIGTLSPVGWPGMFSLTGLGIDITTDHPQTLVITLTSPQGTDLLLSAYNGAGGQNYTGTYFGYGFNPVITTGNAPFTGWWQAQGGSMDVFDWEVGDGTWTITVVDTACANGGMGPDSLWTPGYFNGQNGGFEIFFNWVPPPCPGWIGPGTGYLCPGGTVDILGYYMSMWPNYTYTVYDSWGFIVANPMAVGTTGTYMVQAYDPWDGCSYSAWYDVFQTVSPVLGPDLIMPLCTGAPAVDLTAAFALVGLSYTWTLNGMPISNATAAAAYAPGVYQVVATNLNQCTDTAELTLNVLPAPVLGPDQSMDICLGGTADLTPLYSTTGLTTYWTLAGSAVPNPGSVDIDGIYQLVAVDAGGCSDTAAVAVVVHYPPVLGPDQSTNVCDGTSIDITALFNTSGASAAWSIGGATIAPPTSATTAGAYQLVANSPFGCADTAVVNLAVDPAPALGADQVQQVCGGASFDLTGAFSTTGLTADWTFAGQTVADPTAVAAPGDYQLLAANAGGCSDTAVVTLSNQASFSLGPDQSADICSGATTDLTGYYTTSGYTTVWTSGGGAVTDPTAVGSSGNYMLVATDQNGCTDTAVVQLAVQSNPALGPDQSTAVCDGNSADLTALFTTNGYATAWSYSGNAIAPPVNATSAGDYQLVATSAFSCTDTALATLVLDPVPALGADQAVQSCAGASIDLTAVYSAAGSTAVWSTGGAPVADPTAVVDPGAYQVVASNSFGCADTAVVAVAFNANPSPGPDQAFELCPWQSVDLTSLYSLNGLTATYAVNGSAVNDPAAVMDSGTYMVTVTDANGCTGFATVLVDTVHCLCEARIASDVHCLQDPAYFTALADSAILDVQWDFGGGAGNTNAWAPEVFYSNEGTAYITLQATLSCGVVTVVDTIDLDDCADSCGVFVPNAFSPDGDAVNDVWTMHSECMPEAYLVYIFNRWGELIHTGTDPRSPWDGTYNGTVVQDGVYVYRMVYRMPYQEDHKVIGHVTLLR